MLEETHYYPFGLTMAGISTKAPNRLENKYKFTGQLLDDDLGWNTYQMKWRTMDPQIGRFLQVDPLASDYVHNSTYAYAENDVIRAIDLEGLEKYIVTFRAFIPQKELANPNPFGTSKSFAGDNRTSYQANTSAYRTEQSVNMNFDDQKLSLISNRANGSIGYDRNGNVKETSGDASAGSVRGNVSGMENGVNAGVVNFGVSASNKLVTGAPSIDADMTLTVTPNKDGSFSYSLKGSTDGFPAYELWVTDQKTGDTYLLFNRNPIESKEGPTSLFAPMEHRYNTSGSSKDKKASPVVNFDNTRNTEEEKKR